MYHSEIQVFEHLPPENLGDTPEAFLEFLGGPTAIWLAGEDPTRCRALSTLLHGNEPSGFRAVFEFLKKGIKPKVNALIILGAVQTALASPRFSQRMLPGRRDLNRCFAPPFESDEGKLAENILKLIEQAQPECLIDLHNTSGSGPAFGVSISEDRDHLALTSLFTNGLIVTDLRLGALMELSEKQLPTVTIECGGANDPAATFIAQEGIYRYLCSEQVLAAGDTQYPVNRYHNPMRLELLDHTHLVFSDDEKCTGDLILAKDAERLNYGTVTPDEPLARLGERGLEKLLVKTHLGPEPLEDYFVERDGQLYAKHTMKLFMVTTTPRIALADCLFYFMSCEA